MKLAEFIRIWGPGRAFTLLTRNNILKLEDAIIGTSSLEEAPSVCRNRSVDLDGRGDAPDAVERPENRVIWWWWNNFGKVHLFIRAAISKVGNFIK